MSIELHCPECQKLIRAPESAGGKRGKCPYCKKVVYIPSPPDETEEIGLAPLDEKDVKREAALRKEAIQYAAAVDHATEGGETAGDASTNVMEGQAPAPETEPPDIQADVDAFITAMRDSELDLADAAAAKLKRAGGAARKHVRALMSEDVPSAVENVPPPVVKGFLKTLLTRLK